MISERTMTGGSLLTSTMYRRGADGTVVPVAPDPNEYVTPPRGSRGRFVLNGASEFYETEGQYGPQTRVRLEFLIERVTGNANAVLAGKKFTQSFPVPKNIADERSKLGQFFAALIGRPIRGGDEINPDDFLGTSFVTSTTLDDAGDRQYPGISWQTIEDGSVRLSPHVPAALTGAANGSAPHGTASANQPPVSDAAAETIDDPFDSPDAL